MEIILEILGIVLLAILLIVAIITIVLVSKNRNSESLESRVQELSNHMLMLLQQTSQSNKQIADEFQRNRLDSNQFQQAMREETANSIKEMADKLEQMTKANSEHQVLLSERLNRSLNEIQRNNLEQNDRQSKIIEAAISKMQESNEKKLDEMRSTVDEKLSATLSARLESSFKTVSEQLENVYKSLGEMKELSSGVTNNVTALNRVLTNVKARGTWAEVQLEGILDQTIPNMYEKNVATKDGSSARVEFAIKIPSSEDSSSFTYLPIDSKFPMEDYIRLCDAADQADAQALQQARKALEDRIRIEAKAINAYINEPKTTPFAIMYLATEGLYAEVASSRTGLAERLQSEYNIMIAGPTTITALLNSISMGFRAVAINEKANEVRKLLAAAKAQYETFGGVLEKARRKIDEAGKSLDEAQHRNNIIRKKLRTVEELEQKDAQDILGLDES